MIKFVNLKLHAVHILVEFGLVCCYFDRFQSNWSFHRKHSRIFPLWKKLYGFIGPLNVVCRDTSLQCYLIIKVKTYYKDRHCKSNVAIQRGAHKKCLQLKRFLGLTMFFSFFLMRLKIKPWMFAFLMKLQVQIRHYKTAVG